jgi:hypothetical protein
MNLGREVRTIYVPRKEEEKPIAVPDWPRPRVKEPARPLGPPPADPGLPRGEVTVEEMRQGSTDPAFRASELEA